MKKSLIFLVIIFSFKMFPEENHHSEIHDLMAYVLDPAAESIWDSSGFVITEEGEFSLEPKDDEGWDKVKHGAKVIAESSYLLALPGRAVDQSQWLGFSKALKAIGEETFIAAENKDSEELFRLGADLYQVCVACHKVYWIKDN